MGSNIAGVMLKALEGTRCFIDAEEVEFERGVRHLPAARQGGEGFAVPVRRRDGRHIIKTYHLPSAERRERVAFLAALKLHELLPCFHAVPSAPLFGQLAVPLPRPACQCAVHRQAPFRAARQTDP